MLLGDAYDTDSYPVPGCEIFLRIAKYKENRIQIIPILRNKKKLALQ